LVNLNQIIINNNINKIIKLSYLDFNNKDNKYSFNISLLDNSSLDVLLDFRELNKLNLSDLELDFKIKLLGENSKINLKIASILDNNLNLKINTVQEHLNINTHSDLLLKAICKDKSNWNYTGKIFVDKTALNTKASQVNHNILLSEYAQALSIPSLEVLTDEVQCTHGSAVGQLDPESLLYLSSRGLSNKQAETILLDSFLSEVL